MKKLITLGVLALALAASITLASCAALAEMVVANIPAKYTVRSIALRTAEAYQAVFNQPAPTANAPIKYYFCSKAELDSYFEMMDGKLTSVPEARPEKGLSISDVSDLLQKHVDAKKLDASQKSEILNKLEGGYCCIYTDYFIFAGRETRWGISGFYKEQN